MVGILLFVCLFLFIFMIVLPNYLANSRCLRFVDRIDAGMQCFVYLNDRGILGDNVMESWNPFICGRRACVWLKGTKSPCKQSLSDLAVPMPLLSPWGLSCCDILISLVVETFLLSALDFPWLWFATRGDPNVSCRNASSRLPIFLLQQSKQRTPPLSCLSCSSSFNLKPGHCPSPSLPHLFWQQSPPVSMYLPMAGLFRHRPFSLSQCFKWA